jgi:hypothetical protein
VDKLISTKNFSPSRTRNLNIKPHWHIRLMQECEAQPNRSATISFAYRQSQRAERIVTGRNIGELNIIIPAINNKKSLLAKSIESYEAVLSTCIIRAICSRSSVGFLEFHFYAG